MWRSVARDCRAEEYVWPAEDREARTAARASVWAFVGCVGVEGDGVVVATAVVEDGVVAEGDVDDDGAVVAWSDDIFFMCSCQSSQAG